MSDDPPPPAQRIWRDVGIPSERLASGASDHPVPVETAIRLSEAADQAGLSVHERIALQDATLRRWMARFVIPAFIKANAVTLIAIAALAGLDQFNIAWHLIAPGDRIIGAQVIMALLGATTVQVGTIAVVIALPVPWPPAMTRIVTSTLPLQALRPMKPIIIVLGLVADLTIVPAIPPAEAGRYCDGQKSKNLFDREALS